MKRLLIYIIGSIGIVSCSEPTHDMTPDNSTLEQRDIAITIGISEDSAEISSRVSTTVGNSFSDPWVVTWDEYDSILLVGESSSTTLSMSSFDEDSATFDGTVDDSITSARLFYPTSTYLLDGSGYVTINYANVLDGCHTPAMMSREGAVNLSGDVADLSASMSHIGATMDAEISFTGLNTSTTSYQLISLCLSGKTATVYNRATLEYNSTSSLTTTDSRLIEGDITVSVSNVEPVNDVNYNVRFNILPFEVANGNAVTLTATLLDSSGKVYTQKYQKQNSTGGTISFVTGTHNYLSNITFDMSAVEGSSDKWSDSATLFASSNSGTNSDPIEISTAEELAYLASIAGSTLGKYYRLTSDIDLAGKSWSPIGSATNPFSGNFDGNGYSIYNISISSTDSYQGLFGCISNESSTSTITRVNIASGNISGTEYVGGVVGYGNNLIISDCHNNASITGSKYNGGIVGSLSNSTVEECSNRGAIYASEEKVGGIIGYSTNNTISKCANRGSVVCGSMYHAGGIVGSMNTSSNNSNSIDNCYNMGDVTAPSSVGGISGRLYLGTEISSCYNVGEIKSTNGSSIGSIVGNNTGSGNVLNCYSLESIALGSGSDGTITSSLNLLDGLNNGGSIWYQLPEFYPVLSWER